MHRILVIDDEDLFRQATSCALRRQGFEIHEASDGAAGAELARRLLPDLIICDVTMDKMDGYTLLEALRHESATATIPFILMTGLGDVASMRRGMNLGADDYLTKPFSAPQLFSAVEARLKKHQALRHNAEKKLSDLRANLSLALPHEMITPLNGIFGPAQILCTDADFGIDGGLYVSDWVAGWNKPGKGRIYRVHDPRLDADQLVLETKRLITEGMTQRPSTELAQLLAHSDMRVRQEAQFALAERTDAETFEQIATKNSQQVARLHAVWGLGQLARRSQSVNGFLISLLSDSDPEVRAQAAKVLGDARVAAAESGLTSSKVYVRASRKSAACGFAVTRRASSFSS